MIRHFSEKLFLLIAMIFMALLLSGASAQSISSMFVSAAGGIFGLMAFETLNRRLDIVEYKEDKDKNVKQLLN